MRQFEVIIVGAGAAGLMCAFNAAKNGRKVLLLDSSKKIGEKIRISGGGRCNFTNLNITPDNFLSQNPHFCKSALQQYTQHDFINLVEKHNITYHEKTLGQLFCDKSSKQIIEMLLSECDDYGVTIKTEINISNVSKDEDCFILQTESEGGFKSESLVIATGGLSIPKLGATDFGYKIAKQFGINVIEPTPALVPITLEDSLLSKTKQLSGVSSKSTASIEKRKFDENILFTHKGLSGPAILQISSYHKKGDKININLARDVNILAFLLKEKELNPKQDIKAVLSNILSKNLVLFILGELNISGNLADLSNKKIKLISNYINNWQVKPNGTEGYAKAEVTLGGVDTNEISSKTFEAKKVKNLFFIGEVLDVTGHLGGYNFQWAWSSAFVAAKYV